MSEALTFLAQTQAIAAWYMCNMMNCTSIAFVGGRMYVFEDYKWRER